VKAVRWRAGLTLSEWFCM